ncbi:amidohydrolase family protein [Aequorivita lipolytica]|uniref:Amidohydrolase family protein n=1 Tax=Aequorivita lipolytica TaxID=153267 RepID=A0A5C6YR49_9FLAO|nr:amidohydrolase family protein [Aequorivita lipolytica]TXD69923.1 amidohydrolase family protein [Aequorivita lipolytica]SRX50254.1 Adenine deaminase [Aequorivita lipolytica]
MRFTFRIPKLQKFKQYYLLIGVLLLVNQSCKSPIEQTSSQADLPAEEAFTVIIAGTKVGHLNVTRSGDTVVTNYDYKDNGRGPTIKETIVLNNEGFPVQWDIAGNTTFGNDIKESFKLDGKNASWTDATGEGAAKMEQPSFYVNQSGSPYSLLMQARVLLNSKDKSITALPAGLLQLTELEAIEASSDAGQVKLKSYALSGIGLNPTYFVLDEKNHFFALITPRVIIIRSGFESEEKGMRLLAEKYSAQRYEDLQKRFAHKYEKNIRIRNVKIFDPKTLALTDLSSVLISGDKIVSIDAADVAVGENAIEIDGAGGTLVAGLYDMHGHMGANSALLNVAAGVTSVRDMGNNNEVLDSLVQKIESGVLAGPNITRLGFIEGKSPFNSNNGILVESEEQALAAVQTYADKGFYGIKLYNSMDGKWAPAIVKKAHELNMPVTGHVPAFSNANDMLMAGFDEMTHINQTMLGWVLEPDEDTRTLLRLTALQRLPDLDLNSAPVKKTLDLMVKNKVAMDPTLAIHELLLLSRNGETQVGTLDYIENMPASEQRDAKEAMASIANDDEDKAYRGAYDKIVETLKLMKQRGILILPGTDLGGAFTLHRELELYQQLGYTPEELLKLGSYDMAQYLGQKDRGAIEPGMLADFFLIPNDPTKDIKAIKKISMVSRGGVIYFPSEIYPEFGIKPFVEKPVVKLN